MSLRYSTFVVLSVSGWLFASNAFADCEGWLDTVVDAKIDKVSAPVYDPQGKLQAGCILSADGKVLGYASEDSLCRLTPGRTFRVHLVQSGCCDTGPGPGADFTCGLRARSSAETVYGNGLTVQSVAL